VKSIKIEDSVRQSVRVDANEQVTLEIAGAATTGYLWEVSLKSPAVELLEHRFQPNLESFGGAGLDRFVVRASKPGVQKLILALRAPWEREAIKEFELELNVGQPD